jgi:hypothetical protein
MKSMDYGRFSVMITEALPRCGRGRGFRKVVRSKTAQTRASDPPRMFGDRRSVVAGERSITVTLPRRDAAVVALR